MKLYLVVFYNPAAQQTQTFQVYAENEFRAGRAFHQHYGRKLKDCIEIIQEIKPPKPKIIELLNVYYGYEAQDLTELINDINEEYVEQVPDHLQKALRYLILRVEGTPHE